MFMVAVHVFDVCSVVMAIKLQTLGLKLLEISGIKQFFVLFALVSVIIAVTRVQVVHECSKSLHFSFTGHAHRDLLNQAPTRESHSQVFTSFDRRASGERRRFTVRHDVRFVRRRSQQIARMNHAHVQGEIGRIFRCRTQSLAVNFRRGRRVDGLLTENHVAKIVGRVVEFLLGKNSIPYDDFRNCPV
jgi:hypothetical protein